MTERCSRWITRGSGNLMSMRVTLAWEHSPMSWQRASTNWVMGHRARDPSISAVITQAPLLRWNWRYPTLHSYAKWSWLASLISRGRNDKNCGNGSARSNRGPTLTPQRRRIGSLPSRNATNRSHWSAPTRTSSNLRTPGKANREFTMRCSVIRLRIAHPCCLIAPWCSTPTPI